MNNKSANIIVLGETGNGKSQFCNYVLRNYFFTVSNNADSETKETKGNYGINGANNIFMIDTPGLQDSRGADKEHLTQLVDYVKTQTHLQAVLIIFNFHQPRFALNIKNMVKLLCIAFPQTDFWNHVGLVFTRFYAKMDEELMDEKIDRAEQFNREINKLIKEAGYYSTSEIICPTFFVDSPKIGKTADFNTEEEVKRLIAWASNLIPLDVSKTQNVDPNIMKEIPEVQKRMVRQNQNKNIQTTIYQQYKRMKQIHYNKEITYSEWVPFGDEIIEKKILPKELITTRKEAIPSVKESYTTVKEIDIENTGFFDRVFGNYKTNYRKIPNNILELKYKNIKVYNDGTTEEY